MRGVRGRPDHKTASILSLWKVRWWRRTQSLRLGRCSHLGGGFQVVNSGLGIQQFVRTLTGAEIPKLATAINDLANAHHSEFLPYSTVYLLIEKLKKSFGISI
ncbi:hypothetical protein K7X08_035013 [Anisodus acutangulus]|uniref:Uncharacterized protein n=1 Tax=Anisodus acutangulus TaxID=402998 RepID=A0A9Q1R3H0_9SOLA|nr:hypothetical protein K7X08_035013 [Anisodus acutangulus]